MKLLLDTHVIIWALTDDPQLSSYARQLIENPDNLIFFSVASLWEIAIKNQKAPAKCPYHEDEINNLCLEAKYEILDIKMPHVMAVRTLAVQKSEHLQNHDPFDRILLAQAKAEGMKLITHDNNLSHYDENCLLMF